MIRKTFASNSNGAAYSLLIYSLKRTAVNQIFGSRLPVNGFNAIYSVLGPILSIFTAAIAVVLNPSSTDSSS